MADAVEFTGYLRAPQDKLREMDLFALSSDTEQQPISMLEAMALGIPIIATRVGDVPFIVPDSASSAVLCEPEDAAFTRTLQAVLSQREQWSGWADAGLTRVRSHFAMDDMVERWRLVFDGKAEQVPALALLDGNPT